MVRLSTVIIFMHSKFGGEMLGVFLQEEQIASWAIAEEGADLRFGFVQVQLHAYNLKFLE